MAAVSHLHHTLTVDGFEEKYEWPRPLRNSYNLGLLPLVKRFRIRTDHRYPKHFTPEMLDGRTLRYFSALTNVQELEIDHLDIQKLMPRIRRYFKNFLPTLRSLALKGPKGTCRQILYFIGLFQHLEDLALHYQPPGRWQAVGGLKLIPLFAPPLRGRLTMTNISSVDLLKDMVHLFGGIRFRYVDLFYVQKAWLWIDACVETLETLRFYPTSEQPSERRTSSS